jgi:phospholipid/cholesterol/gamma-HCH transport system substrate-binding protein
MEKENGNRIRLGIFVSVAVGLFILVIYFIGNRQHMFSKTFRISGTFKDIGGLQVGNHVRFSGINVGTIDRLEITTDSSVKVELVIEKDVQKFIKSDVKASIGSEGLMGNKVVNIISGSPDSPDVQNNGTIMTIDPVNLDDIMANLKVTTDNASLITGDIAVITNGMRHGKGAIGKLFMDSAFAETLNQTMVNAKNATGGLNENMEAAKHNFLLRGYFKKKEKEAEDAKKAEDKKQKLMQK